MPCHQQLLSHLPSFFLFIFFLLFKDAGIFLEEGHEDNLLTPGHFISKQAMLDSSIQSTWAVTVSAAASQGLQEHADSVVARVTYRHSYTWCATGCSQDFFLCETRYSVLPTRWKPVPSIRARL